MHGDMPTKLCHLINARQHLLRCAHLANVAFAFQLLSGYATRIERARLSGLVNLKSAAADEETCWASLTALEGNQSLIEEHFTDEDLMDMTDAIAYITASDVVDLTFQIQHFADMFVTPVRAVLEQSGISVDAESCELEESSSSDLA